MVGREVGLGGIKNRLKRFVASEMKGRRKSGGRGRRVEGESVLTEVCRAFGTAIMSHISHHALLFIADLARKQKINNFEQI